MLNIEYDRDFLARTYRDTEMTLTRRENGEHEYRYAEWEESFGSAGFRIESAAIIRSGATTSSQPNDAGITEVHIDAPLGGYLSSKVGYVLSASN